MSVRSLFCIAAAAALVPPAVHPDPTRTPSLRLEYGTTAAGESTEAWIKILRRRLPPEEAARFAGMRRVLSADERAWAGMLKAKLPAWEREIGGLAAPFRPIAPPEVVTIVIGNRGASDAFTHDGRTIGFDLAALQQAYGPAGAPGNPERLDRFFRHEYTHVMQKGWWAEHPYDGGTPLRLALAEMWAEGLGNYHSLSSRWRSDGAPSEAAKRARAELEPRLIARVAALACAPAEQAEELTADLSWGRFDRKWGALVPALWLAAEPRPDAAFRSLIVAGPDGIWSLAERHLSSQLAAVLAEARVADSLCHRRPG